MTLQNCIFPEKTEYRELYYHASDRVCQSKECFIIPPGYAWNTCTYMNSFDIGAWKKYTDISHFLFCMQYEGKGKLTLVCEQKDGTKQVIEKELSESRCELEFPKEFEKGIVYVSLTAWEEFKLFKAYFETREPERQNCKIALVICTYKRKEFIEKNIKTLTEYADRKQEDDWLDTVIIDNASELENCYGKGVRIYHNRNTGGSGGFSRGMDEVVGNLANYPATHVVLMDDDVEFKFESFIRLRALLSYLKDPYLKEPVAGRMFRMDKPTVQYTALEIWNGGDLKHIGWNQDMTLKENFWSMNDNEGGEYGGWWFECYPMEFVKDNRPLPFFIHCDDVEYGLRHGGTPIILNGIQVWHETYEYRNGPIISYYDARNTLIVNAIYEVESCGNMQLKRWKVQLGGKHLEKDYMSEYMVIKGMLDFLKGDRWFYNHNPLINHNKLLLCKERKLLKIANAFLWRITVVLYWVKKSGKWTKINNCN